MQVRRQADAQAELGVVLEQRVGPRGPAAHGVLRPRRGGQVAAVDRRASGGVGDGGAVTEQLAQQLEVGRLAAAGARAGELEERLEKLGAADGAEVHPGAVVLGDGLEVVDRRLLLLAVQDRHQFDRAPRRLVHGLDRAGLHAQPAAGAVLHVDLQGVAGLRQAGGVERRREETLGGVADGIGGVALGAQYGVRADERAVAALDAGLGVPFGHDLRDVALLELGGARRVGAVHRQRRHRKVVAATLEHARRHRPHEFRRVLGDRRDEPVIRRRVRRHVHLVQLGQRGVDRLVVLAHHLRGFAGVGLGDGVLDLLDRLVAASRIDGGREQRHGSLRVLLPGDHLGHRQDQRIDDAETAQLRLLSGQGVRRQGCGRDVPTYPSPAREQTGLPPGRSTRRQQRGRP